MSTHNIGFHGVVIKKKKNTFFWGKKPDLALLCIAITKTCLYNFDPLKPHFYIVKLGFTRVYNVLYLLKNIDCGYSLELPR